MDCRAPCGSPRADPLADGAMAGSKWDISKIWWILMNETLPKHVETTKILSWSPTYQEIPGALDHGAKVQFYPLRRPSIPSALREFVGVQHRYHGPLGPHSTAADLYAHPPCAHAKSPQQTPAAAFKARAMMENGGRAPSACHFNGKNHGKSMWIIRDFGGRPFSDKPYRRCWEFFFGVAAEEKWSFSGLAVIISLTWTE